MKKTKGKKVTRRSDLLFYGDLLNTLGKIKQLIPLIIDASYWIERDRIKDKNKLLWNIVHWYNIEPAYLKKNLKYLKELSAILLELINALKTDLDDSIKFLLNDKKVPQVKKWFIDRFGEAAERYLPDWKTHKGHLPKPDFESSYRIFVSHVKDNRTGKELGFGKRYPKRGHNAKLEHKVKNPKDKSPKDLRYRVIPQGKIELLFIIHSMLYHLIEKERTRLKSKKEQLKELLKDSSGYEVVQMLDDIGKGRRIKPAIGSRTFKINDIIYPHPYDRIRLK